ADLLRPELAAMGRLVGQASENIVRHISLDRGSDLGRKSKLRPPDHLELLIVPVEGRRIGAPPQPTLPFRLAAFGGHHELDAALRRGAEKQVAERAADLFLSDMGEVRRQSAKLIDTLQKGSEANAGIGIARGKGALLPRG